MNTIHKHFLVLLTISTTVWGNPAIESSIPTADQPSIQKNSLTKESWSKKKIARLTAAAIFTSSIIAIKGKAQPTQDPQYAQEPQPLPFFARTGKVQDVPPDPSDDTNSIITERGYNTPQAIIFSIRGFYLCKVKDILINAHNKKYNWATVFYIRNFKEVLNIHECNNKNCLSQQLQTGYSIALALDVYRWGNRKLASILFYLGHSFLIRPVKGSPVPREFYSKGERLNPDNPILRNHIRTTNNYNLINPYRKLMPLEKGQQPSIFFNIPVDVRKIIYNFLPHIHWIDITIDPQTNKFITKTDDEYEYHS